MMKRFKFGLVGIVLGLFGLISFSNAGSFIYNGHFEGTRSNAGRVVFSIPSPFNNMNIPTRRDFKLTCTFSNYTGVSSMNLKLHEYYYSSSNFSFQDNVIYQQDIVQNNVIFIDKGYIQQDAIGFAFYNTNVFSDITSFDYSCVYTGTDVVGGGCPSCPECETCPEVNTGDILSGSCDTNYCVENDLCPVASNFSQLFINDIEHQSAPLINITIPYEYSWDSSVNSGQFDLVISGQNVDYEYIDNIVRTQNSKPSTEDFNNIITGLIPLFIPGLVVILFIWFVFRFIKKIF